MKKKMVSLVLAAMFLIAFSGVANAGNWFDCNVIEVGVSGTSIITVKLQESGGQFNRYFNVPGADPKVQMAVFLTAQSTGTQVRVYLNSITTTGMTAVYGTNTPVTNP